MMDACQKKRSSFFPGLKIPQVCVGLVLGGGAARALAHIGVIKTLNEAQIPINVISGCSLGALAGGCFAATDNIGALETSVREYIQGELFKKKTLEIFRIPHGSADRFSITRFIKRGLYYGRILFRPSFYNYQEFESIVASVVPDVEIGDLTVPFGCNAANLSTGKEEIFTSGRLRPAVMASSAVPGIFPPMEIGKNSYIDGGWVDPLPVKIAHNLGADFIIAVDVSYRIATNAQYHRGLSIVYRGLEIKSHRLVELARSLADVVIRVDVDDIAWADFMRFEEIIKRGEEATRKAIPQIYSLLKHKRWKKRIPFRDTILKILK